ncbi:hypothetical protein FQZ97_779320 [compost metagenome]
MGDIPEHLIETPPDADCVGECRPLNKVSVDSVMVAEQVRELLPGAVCVAIFHDAVVCLPAIPTIEYTLRAPAVICPSDEGEIHKPVPATARCYDGAQIRADIGGVRAAIG